MPLRKFRKNFLIGFYLVNCRVLVTKWEFKKPTIPCYLDFVLSFNNFLVCENLKEFEINILYFLCVFKFFEVGFIEIDLNFLEIFLFCQLFEILSQAVFLGFHEEEFFVDFFDELHWAFWVGVVEGFDGFTDFF